MQVEDEIGRLIARLRAPLPLKQVREALAEAQATMGARIRALREAFGLSQAALANEVSELLPTGRWHQTAVAKVEAGTRPLKIEEAWALVFVFRLSSPLRLLSADTGDLSELMLQVSAQTEVARAERVLDAMRMTLEGLGVEPEELNAALDKGRRLLPADAQGHLGLVDLVETLSDAMHAETPEARRLERKLHAYRRTRPESTAAAEDGEES